MSVRSSSGCTTVTGLSLPVSCVQTCLDLIVDPPPPDCESTEALVPVTLVNCSMVPQNFSLHCLLNGMPFQPDVVGVLGPGEAFNMIAEVPCTGEPAILCRKKL